LRFNGIIRSSFFRRAVSILTVLAVLGFAFMGSFQSRDRFSQAVTFQFGIIDSAVLFMQNYIIKPYLSCFIEVKDYVNGGYGFLDTYPGQKSAGRGCSHRKTGNFYFLISTLFIINRDISIFLILALFGFIATGRIGIKSERRRASGPGQVCMGYNWGSSGPAEKIREWLDIIKGVPVSSFAGYIKAMKKSVLEETSTDFFIMLGIVYDAVRTYEKHIKAVN